MDRILERQLKKLRLLDGELPDKETWENFQQVISHSYSDSDKERRLLEHVIQVNSDEMHQLNLRLKEKVELGFFELNASETKQEIVLETLADGVIIISDKGIIEGFNQAAEQIFNYSKKEIIGQNVSILMPESEQKVHDSYVEKTVIRGSSDIFHRSRELLGRTKTGKTFPLELNVAPLGEGIGGFVGILRDISERQAHEKELVDAKNSAELSNKAKSLFLASMSHELRTPLNAILGFAELFEYAPNLDEQYKQNAEEIRLAGEHLLTLINEVLDMSKIESGTIELSTEVVYLKDIFDECFVLSQNQADQKQISIQWKGSDNQYLKADYTRLKQVILNLISNAIKYNQLQGSVICSCERINNNILLIKIEDNGYGIDESLLCNLFDPFNRLGAENSAIEGTGLGLSISKKLVEAMGGEIGVESTKDVGTCFWIEIKGEPESRVDGGELNKLSKLPEIGPRVEGAPAILYIEDNPASQHYFERVAKLSGVYNLMITDTAEEGLKIAKKVKPQMVLVDIDLPGMDGYEALLRLRQMPELNESSIIGISANGNHQDRNKVIKLGFDDFLIKPVSVSVLKEVIGKATRRIEVIKLKNKVGLS